MSASAAYIFGFPIGHSISPAIHNAAFAASGLETRYSAREVEPADLPAAVRELRSAHVLGANITVPHKQAVLGLVDEVDAAARAIGAANTIHNLGGRLLASNTDAPGFARALVEAGLPVAGARIVLLGAGGSARAVAEAVLQGGAGELLIANRTGARAEQLALGLRPRFPASAIRSRPLAALQPEDIGEASLIVNTTTVGLHGDDTPLAARLLPAGAAVVDIIYNPPRTRLLREAERAGLPTLNGLPMLVHQAALAWETWMNRPAPLEVMAKAAGAALNPSR